MNKIILLLLPLLTACASQSRPADSAEVGVPTFEKGWAQINGLQMYYEIHGLGPALVLLHGGGSTLEIDYARAIPELAKNHRVILFEEQGHGRTKDIDRAETFEQTADDVAAALKVLKITGPVDVMGFSNGGNAAMQIAIRHPEAVRRLIVASSFYKRAGMVDGFWKGMQGATLTNMPNELKDAYIDVAPNPANLQKMFERDLARMMNFKDWPAAALKGIKAPTLFVGGDRDVVKVDHFVEMSRLVPGARLAILPGGHESHLGTMTHDPSGSRNPAIMLNLIEEFLR